MILSAKYGAVPTSQKIAAYDLSLKAMSNGARDAWGERVRAALVASFGSSPVDVIKTRIMSAHENKGLMRLLSEIYKAEGIGWMFRGWVPSFIRLGPHTIATFLFLEQHKKIYRQLKGYPEHEH